MKLKPLSIALCALVTSVFASAALAEEAAPEEKTPTLEERVAELEKNAVKASYAGKFKIQDNRKGAYSMEMQSQLQVRFTSFDSHDDSETDSDEGEFRIRRLKTSFKGHVISKEWKYETTIAFNSSTLNEAIETAYLGYQGDSSWGIYMGKQKMPWNLEEMTSSKRQQFVDRSEANEDFNQDFAHGMWLSGAPSIGETGLIRYWLGVYNGIQKDGDEFMNKDKAGSPSNDDYQFLYNGRVEFLPMGGADDVGKYASDLRKDGENSDLLVLIGGAVNWYVDRTNAGRDTDLDPNGSAFEAAITQATFDMRIHVSGISFNAAYFYRYVRFENANEDAQHPGSLNDQGVSVALGYNMNLESGDQFEVAFQFSHSDFDEFNDGGTARRALHNDIWQYTAGVNYRVQKEYLKISLDVSYITQSQVGGNEIPVWVTRLQAQILF